MKPQMMLALFVAFAHSEWCQDHRRMGGGTRGMRTDRGNDGERGATLVEMAIVLPILLLLVFGIIELGLAFRTFLGASSAASAGSRVVALMGNDPESDCEALREIAATLGDGDALESLAFVEIYRADGGGNQRETNRYTYLSGDPSDCDNGWARGAFAWDPIDRQTLVGSRPLDIAGVKVVVEHDWVTDLPPFTGSFLVEETTLTRLEPEAFET
jgi:hypothetical protein